jgi:hypothetical protein
MSGEERIHYLALGDDVSPCNVNIATTPYTYASPEWSEVTCGECRLEMPLAEPERAPEYRVPQHVLAMDAVLGLRDELAAAERNYDRAVAAAAEAARLAEQSSAQVARIRSLLAEHEPDWRADRVRPSGVSQGLSAGCEYRLSKPGPY